MAKPKRDPEKELANRQRLHKYGFAVITTFLLWSFVFTLVIGIGLSIHWMFIQIKASPTEGLIFLAIVASTGLGLLAAHNTYRIDFLKKIVENEQRHAREREDSTSDS